MFKPFKLLLIGMLVLPAGEVLGRTRVTVYARPTAQPVAPPIVAVVPVVVLGMHYDIWRRTNCAGDVLGFGGPGFDSDAPGNYLVPAIYRQECLGAQPKRYAPRGYSVINFDPWMHQEPDNGHPRPRWWE